MDGDRLAKILMANPQTRQVFRGCYAADKIPKAYSLRFPAAMVVNLDTHQFKGSHWIAVFAQGLDREVVYFDSLNLPTSPIIEQSFLGAFPRTIRNTHAYQSISAQTCPHYCICFIYYLSIGYTLPQFLKLLDTNIENDLFVKELINKMIE